MSEIECADWLAQAGACAESRLGVLLNRISAPPPLREAMQYAALDGGKRLRPAMLFAAAEVSFPPPAAAVDAACALECMHCYSLVHDDLPCMDDSAERRGAPSCHAKFGESLALLAGDCLHSLAFEILAESGLPPSAAALLARSGGAAGMGGGQFLDLQAAAEDEESLRQMHEMKTGALFDCALQLGLLCRAQKAAAAEQTRLQKFAAVFGRLFQIVNDINGAHADSAGGKTTYWTVLGAAEAARHADSASRLAAEILDGAYPRLAEITGMVRRAA